MEVKFVEDFFNKNFDLKFSDFSEISTDTRTIKKDAFFIALKGENFDGNNYINDAFNKGAAVVLGSKAGIENPNYIQVRDSLESMQKLARAWQDLIGCEVLAITGSNGKTTAKFFTHQLLKDFVPLSFSQKSFNNEIGVPITQLNLQKNHKYMISEIGTNHPGEIEALTKLISPHASVVTTVGPAHIEAFHTLENIAIEKSQIYQHSPRAKCFIFNLDNEFTKRMSKDFSAAKKITFSTQEVSADICLSAKQISISALEITGHVFNEKIEMKLPIFGEHHVYNIMIALAFGNYVGIATKDLIEKLPSLRTPWGRCQVYETKTKGEVLFDAYNANLQSVRALLASVNKLKLNSPQIILGEMLELGDEAPKMHEQLGKEVGEMGFETICFIGESMSSFEAGVRASNFNKKLIISNTYDEKLALDLENVINPSSTIFMKGSRGIGLEKILPLWVEPTNL